MFKEQFPAEVEQRRKSLFPVMRDARRRHKKVKLVRDRLYIDGVEYVPPEGHDVLTTRQNAGSPPVRQDRKRARVGSS